MYWVRVRPRCAQYGHFKIGRCMPGKWSYCAISAGCVVFAITEALVAAAGTCTGRTKGATILCREGTRNATCTHGSLANCVGGSLLLPQVPNAACATLSMHSGDTCSCNSEARAACLASVNSDSASATRCCMRALQEMYAETSRSAAVLFARCTATRYMPSAVPA